jgi:PhzF family phenazine biosynthesis protein
VSAAIDNVPATIGFWHVDSFTDTPLAGNPAAVFLLPSARDTAWCQAFAAEMMVPNSAFLVPPLDRGGAWNLRWFTPTYEVDLCGHATLASAHVLWETGRIPVTDSIQFETRSGLLTASRRKDSTVELDLPAEPLAGADPVPGLADELGSEIRWLGRGRTFLVAELASESVVRALRPNLVRLADATRAPLAVTAASDDPAFDYVCRIFAPAIGIPEDPVTGSAQCALAPLWASRLGRTDLRGHQLSARGGVVSVRVTGDRVMVGGPATTVVRGEISG